MLQSSSSEKKLVKLLNIAIFGPNLHKKGVSMSHIQTKKYLFGINSKNRSSAFRKFLFYQNIIISLSLFLFCVVLFCQKGSFPAITAVISTQVFVQPILFALKCICHKNMKKPY